LAYGKLMGWALSLNWEGELTRLRLIEQLDPVRAADLEPDYPGKNPIILEGVGSAESTRLLATAGLLLNEYEKVKQWLGDWRGQGSNSWVLSPKNSLNRRPLLCNDPHLGVQIPGVWYENHLICPDYEVSGASFPGAPGVIIGHNAHIAWGMTNAGPDVQDLYIERAHEEDATRFEFAGQWEQAQVMDEAILVKGWPQPHHERVVITRHGPLISGLLERSPVSATLQAIPLALRWVGHEPGQMTRAILRLNQAKNWEDFDSALADWSVPAQNVTYADVEGNIGYIMAGKAPVRDKNLGLTPAPGWDGDHEWSGHIPHGDLPRLYNPPSGKIVTANNKMVGDDYPYFLGVEFLPGWRAARLEEMLRTKDRYTIRDMEEMQLDTTSKFAQSLTPWIALLNSEDPWEKVALTHLRKWNYRMDSDSAAALIFHYTLIHLLEMAFGDKLGAIKEGYFGVGISPLFLLNSLILRAQTRLLELLNDHETSIWYMDAARGRQRTREELLQEALSRAVRSIRAELGDSAQRWHWGRVHQVRYGHPMGGVRMLRAIFNRGPIPVGGDGATPNQTFSTPQLPPGLVQVMASYRQIYEVGVWDRAQTVTTSGQSGHPLSEHYDDQILLWREGVYHPMPWSREEAEKATRYRMLLERGGET
jgi:penicillin amidase